jgi:hypothetical protein
MVRLAPMSIGSRSIAMRTKITGFGRQGSMIGVPTQGSQGSQPGFRVEPRVRTP